MAKNKLMHQEISLMNNVKNQNHQALIVYQLILRFLMLVLHNVLLVIKYEKEQLAFLQRMIKKKQINIAFQQMDQNLLFLTINSQLFQI